ncbi:general secretion pathway protein GspB [Ideonella margarita]|uniref:General secretion pathway protein GspB n=1 Tax=Ideonella margarita TaxID=2984191 RepID=A0ABU9C3F1_9BURK
MSFILDALKRAEEERARGQVPGVHTPAAALAGMAPARGFPLARVGVAVGGLAAVCTVGLFVWQMNQSRDAINKAAVPVAADGVAAASAVSVSRADVSPPGQVPAALPGVAAASTVAVAAPADPRLSVSAPPKSAKTVDVVTPPVKKAAVAEGATRGSNMRMEAEFMPPGMAAPAKVIPFDQIPASRRAHMPKLLVSGGMYSEQASSRMVIVNDQVWREGESPMPGVEVEAIRIRSVVLSWQDLRFELRF